ncbi:hypothetical protein FHL15_003517 [Xylaria flabelliformis]|uniref:Protein kinase domain-containing protein n=1 Tax=Xylaria flabelliformis TaxID=2512241 RepID=A0A553I5T0_9PEZI|nr:hypothetical protein FHL15_003517 [Xylaria flabelliformis]
MSQSSGPIVDFNFQEYLGLQSEVWWHYRVKGTPIARNRAQKQAIYARYDEFGAPPIPSADPLRFFENWQWRRSKYLFGQETNNVFDGPSNGNEDLNTRNGRVRARRRELADYFGQQRYAMQRILGAGGNGIAIHFRDQGPHGVVPGRDFVVKVALEGWQSDELVIEKRMMKKVKGSAHCVQVFEPQDIGLPEEEPTILPLQEIDSSTDGDSSGNESLSRAENGNLADLLTKLNEHEREDGFTYRIPNRVLWGFWLCLIRACIAMEYPPRKFHPLRKKPQPTTQNAVDFVQAKANKMIRDLKALGIRILMPGEREQLEDEERRRESEYQQLVGDLIEDLPERPGGPDQWKLERRQNMVHRDIDPTNSAFIPRNYDRGRRLTISEFSLMALNLMSHQYYIGKKHERLSGNQRTLPIQVARARDYYHCLRSGGKHGDYPPEFFTQEWDYIPVDRWGDQLADSRTCGYYSNKMNIWSSALTMWELITKFLPPTPPAPQPPYDEVDNYPPYNMVGQTDMDQIFNDPKYADFKISYCALLRDPRVQDYDWVDEKLRETIFKCMYHKPDDRPSLDELLSEAERNVELDLSGESDEEVRRWIQYWFFDAPSGGPSRTAPGEQPSVPPGGQPPTHPTGQEPAPLGGQLQMSPILIPASPLPSGAEPGLTAMMRQRINRLHVDFPNGYDRVFNSAAGNLCGLFALIDSLKYQLGLNPTINGVTHHINSLPTMDELTNMHETLLTSGALDHIIGAAPDLAAQSNFNVDILCVLLNTWAQQVNIELELVCKVRGKSELTYVGSPFANPKFIYIYNDNAEELFQQLKIQTLNHYEGMKPKQAPLAPWDNGNDLPDYESDDDNFLPP